MENVQLQPPTSGKYLRFAIYFLVLILGLLAIIYFSNKEKINNYWHNRMEAKQTERCLSKGGNLIETGCGIGNCTYKCAMPYPDAGRSCTSSLQCSGRCLATSGALPSPFEFFSTEQKSKEMARCQQVGKYTYNCENLNLLGACEQQEPANCENFWELSDKQVTAVFADCRI